MAVELCQALRKRHWLCGFLSRIADQAMLDALVQVPTARLVVIDYAESRVEQLELLLPLLKASATSRDEPVRVLLLTRTASPHAENWSERLQNRVDSLDAVLDDCDVRTLEDSPLGEQDKGRIFAEAAEAFATRIEKEPPPTPTLDEEVFSSPLMIVIAAYLAVHGSTALLSTRQELLDEVLAHERRYWRDSSKDLDVDDVLLHRLVALATLVNAESERQGADLLRLLPDLRDASGERRTRLARWLRAQYPGPRWWNPLEPDLVGEHLVAEALGEQVDVLRKCLDFTHPDTVTRPLEVLARAAADHPDLEIALRPILDDALEQLCEIAITQAETVKDQDLLYGNAVTVASALAAMLRSVRVDDGTLPSAINLLPPHSNLVLNELAVTLSARHLEGCRRAGDPDQIAGALNNLSNRLADIGRHEEALEAIEEAVALRRSLAETNSTVRQDDLAMTLNNLCNRLGEAGRQEEALAAIEEAVDTYRRLNAADSASYGPYLAIALNNLCNRLALAGRREEALAAIEEAVAIRRPLAEASPAHAADLAMSLHNHSLRLSDAGQREEALAAIEEAVDRYRQLAESNPAAYGPYLANTLNNLCIRLGEAGRQEESLAASEEAVETCRHLAAANPAVYRPDLASALNNLCIRLAASGKHEAALAASERSVEVYRPLAHENPLVYGPELASALNNLCNRLAESERSEEALAASEEAVAIRRALVRSNSAAYSPHLASALNNLCVRLGEVGRHEESLAAIEEAVAIRRPLAEANPTAQGDELARSLKNLAARLSTLERHEDALAASEEAALIRRNLAETYPAIYGIPFLASLQALSEHLEDCGKKEEAQDVRSALSQLASQLSPSASADLAPAGGEQGVRPAPGETPALEADGGGEEGEGK
ncbi:MAG: tetratricopeptide repeat protein [Solirubrobacterales bacterium]